MVLPDEGDENKTYTHKEVMDMLAAQKAERENDLNERMSKLMEDRLTELLNKRLPPGTVVVASPSTTNAPVSENPLEGATKNGDPSKNGSSSSYNSTPYTYPPQYVPMPHMNPSGMPPKLDENNFSFWKSSMRSHLRSVCVELWGVVENGFEPVDERSMTPVEKINCQLNSTALDKIRQCLKREVYDQVVNIESAKELWDKLSVLFEGTTAIQRQRYEAAKQDMQMFVINDGETLASAYARLIALKEKIRGLGGDRFQDGFVVNDEFIKSKFLQIISPHYQELAFNVNFLDPLRQMTSDQLVGYFVAHDDMVNTAKRTKDIARAMNKTNLALKAKVVHIQEEEDEEEEYEEQDEEEEMTSTSELDVDLAFFAKKYGKFVKKGGFSKERKRVCYNCDEPGHFADKCPYEKREDKPKYTKETRPKLKPNPINNKFKGKKREVKALLGTEYTSDDEEEDDEKVVGVAGLVLAEPGSLFKYDYSKDYKSTNNNSSHTCLMAMGAKVTSSSTSSSAIDYNALDDDELLARLHKVMCSLRGEARA